MWAAFEQELTGGYSVHLGVFSQLRDPYLVQPLGRPRKPVKGLSGAGRRSAVCRAQGGEMGFLLTFLSELGVFCQGRLGFSVCLFSVLFWFLSSV